MRIFRPMKKLFSKVQESVNGKIATDKWGDAWLDPRIDFGNDPPDLAACQRRNSIVHNKCPHCGQKELRLGPTGPGSQNLLCAACGSKFNEGGIFGVDLLRDCTNPIPEMKIDATHNHLGSIPQPQDETCGHIRPGEWQCNCEDKTKPCSVLVRMRTGTDAQIEIPDRRGAIVAQKARKARLELMKKN